MDIQKIIRYLITGGVFAVILVTPFYISRALFFPYITGKGFIFRIAVEIIFALWIILAILDKNYRPKLSPVLWAAGAVVFVLTLSTIFGANPYRSFWSNYERMEGLISHLHLFAYFLVLTGVFKTSIRWRRFFCVVSASGALMALYGYRQALGLTAISLQSGIRADGTFGNASYMAVFMILNAFIATHLFFSEERRWLKIIFGLLAVLEIPVVFLTATRGAILGLMGGVALLAVLFSFLAKDRRVRWASISIVASVFIIVVVFLFAQNTNFVAQNYVLQRFRNLDFSERTVQSRFLIWEMSFEGLKERPVLGWGMENYNQVFNKYYKPELWQQEQWFDRSHNIIFDWLIHGGILGLLAYLSLYGSAIYVLWRGYVRKKLFEDLAAGAVLTSLLGAYFIHNFFVFDNLISYILFFSVLAFVHFRHTDNTDESGLRPAGSLTSSALSITPAQSFGSAFIVLALIVSLYFFNVKPLLANTRLLQALKDANSQGQNVDLVLSDFEKVFGYRTFGTGEAREQLISYVNAIARSGVDPSLKDKAFKLSLSEFENQVKESPNDARGHIFLSAVYSHLGRNEEALSSAKRALELSPKKQSIMFLVADYLLVLRDAQGAYEAVKTAYELDTSNGGAAINFAVVAMAVGLQNEAEKGLLDHFGQLAVPNQQIINAYAGIGRYDLVRDSWITLIKDEPKNAQHHVNLAATYLQLGERQKSIEELERAIELNPAFKGQGGDFLINEIKAGRNPLGK